MSEIMVREAVELDVDQIREIFLESYGGEYPYQYFYDEHWLKRSVFVDDLVMVVAEELDTGRLLGTGSIVFDIGAHSDLMGEFGRLAVRPDARGKGVASAIMEHRVALIESRLHVAVVDNRTEHPFSQQLSKSHGFAAVGFLPLKHCFAEGDRESIAMFVRHFGIGLSLRKNHPRIIPEVAPLANLALTNCRIGPDVVVDQTSSPYPHDDEFEDSWLQAEGMPSLLRIERGRLQEREVFGPMRLNYGFFKLGTRHASYIIARRPLQPASSVSGAIGFIHDEFERNIRVFELIATTDHAIRFLFDRLLQQAAEWGVEYIEVEVSAHAPRMQRTLSELGFVACAYVPAMVFHQVERLDVVKMVRLLIAPDIGEPALCGQMNAIAEMVMSAYIRESVVPRVASIIDAIQLFEGLTSEQTTRTASSFQLANLGSGEVLFKEGDASDNVYVVLAGEVQINVDEHHVGTVRVGEPLAETAMLSDRHHNATATAIGDVELAILGREAFDNIVRLRPDIGVKLYRNLALALGRKLRNLDRKAARFKC